MIDVSLVLERLIPNARFAGSMQANNKDAYEAIIWKDERVKPTWEEIEADWAIYSSGQSITENNDLIKAKIVSIESKQLRATREAWLGYEGSRERLQALDDQIAALRGQLR